MSAKGHKRTNKVSLQVIFVIIDRATEDGCHGRKKACPIISSAIASNVCGRFIPSDITGEPAGAAPCHLVPDEEVAHAFERRYQLIVGF